MGLIIHNHPKYSDYKEGNANDERLVGNQKRLRLEAMKVKKPES